MLNEDIVESVAAECASPIVFATKNNGSLRPCVDYWRQNSVFIGDPYPLLHIDKCIDLLGVARIFSTLDANFSSWIVNIYERDREDTDFTSHDRPYQFVRMLFELKNAPATFQWAIDVILSSIRWQSAFIFIDDIDSFSINRRTTPQTP